MSTYFATLSLKKHPATTHYHDERALFTNGIHHIGQLPDNVDPMKEPVVEYINEKELPGFFQVTFQLRETAILIATDTEIRLQM